MTPEPYPYETRSDYAQPTEPAGPPRTAPDTRPPARRGGSCLLSLLAAFFGALFGAGLVAALVVALYGLPGDGDVGDILDTGNGIDITTSDDIGYAEAVAAKVMPSVVAVGVQATVRDPLTGQAIPQTVGGGSGVVIRADGYILTNDHVIANAESLTVTMGFDEMPAEVVGRDPSSDLAVLKVDANNLTPIEIGSSADLRVGQAVVAIGSPFGLDQTVTTGIVSALGRSSFAESAGAQLTAYTSLIQTDAAINPGNSGGALTDAQGRLIGINTLIQTGGTAQSAGVGFAIPVDYAIGIANELIDTGSVTHPFLGVSTMTVNAGVARRFDLSVDSGALVDSVSPDSPAEDAGIAPGDIIVRIGDMDVRSVEDVFAAVRAHNVGDTVEIELVRDGERETIEVTLAPRPEDR